MLKLAVQLEGQRLKTSVEGRGTSAMDRLSF